MYRIDCKLSVLARFIDLIFNKNDRKHSFSLTLSLQFAYDPVVVVAVELTSALVPISVIQLVAQSDKELYTYWESKYKRFLIYHRCREAEISVSFVWYLLYTQTRGISEAKPKFYTSNIGWEVEMGSDLGPRKKHTDKMTQ